MIKILSLTLFAACAAQKSNNSEFPKRIADCDNSASCRAIYNQAVFNVTNHNCNIEGKLTCDEAIANMNAAKIKLDNVSGQEDRAAVIVGEVTEKQRQQALEKTEIERKQAFHLKAEFCRDTELQRKIAQDNFSNYSRVYNDNKSWVERNCKKQQITKQECATNSRSGKTICRTDTFKVILNCGSNPRPLKLDGTRLNDTDILDNKFGSDDREIVDQLTDEKQMADKQEAECSAL